MTTEAKPLYNAANTVVTVDQDYFDRKNKDLRRMRRGYCAMPKGTDKYAYSAMFVLANELTGVAEYEDAEKLLGKKDELDQELGGLLLKACVADLKHAGYTTLIIHGATEQELNYCQELSAEGALTFIEHDNTVAPLTLAQVMQGTDYMEQQAHTSREFGSGSYTPGYFDVFLDLGSINDTGWPQAIDQEPYLEQLRSN